MKRATPSRFTWCAVLLYAFMVPPSYAQEAQKLGASDGLGGDQFGVSVSLSGDVAVSGASRATVAFLSFGGAAYVYRFDGASWVEETKLVASDAVQFDQFGRSVSVNGNAILVGAWGRSCTTGFACGAAYVYRFDGASWNEEAVLTASDAAANDQLGVSASLSGDLAVVGANLADCASGVDCGATYVYRYDGVSWLEEAKLTASDAAAEDGFGFQVSLSGNVAVVGAFGDDCAAGIDCGAAYVYRFDGASWVEEAKLTASNALAEDRFGISVSLNGNVAIVGADAADCPAGLDCGAAYVYRFDGVSWNEEAVLTASDASSSSFFGDSVSVSGTTAVVGASFDDCAAGNNCGAIYRYEFDGATWVEQAKLVASDPDIDDILGGSVYVSGTVALAGAYGDDCQGGGLDCGAAYTFNVSCGDGIVDLGETCDDANTVGLDGCTAGCTLEPGFQCLGQPSVCTFTCGDGVIDPREECDDSNVTEGDGCSALCVVEPDYVCTGEPSVCAFRAIRVIIDATGDGMGNMLSFIVSLVVDSADNVYVSGANSRNAFKITPSGMITQIIELVSGVVAVDPDGNVYVSNFADVFKIAPDGVITQIFDGASQNISFVDGMATDSAGNVYLFGRNSDNAFKTTPTGVTTQIIDSAGDGTGHTLNSPSGIATDAVGNVYVCGQSSNNAFQLTPSGVITQIIDFTGDGAGNALAFPLGIAVDSVGNVYVVDMRSVFKISPSGPIVRVMDSTGDGLGNGFIGNGGIAVDSADNVYVTGSSNAFKITPSGAIIQIIDSSGDGIGNALRGSLHIAADSSGNVFVGDASVPPLVFKITAGTCGDGVISPTEQCDDLNISTGDGCSAVCTVEPGFECIGEPSVCTFICGDGVIDFSEECDDFNVANGDGCSGLCTLETGFRCFGEPSACNLRQITEIIDRTGDGTGNLLIHPERIAVDAAGNVFVTSQLDKILKITPGGVITQIIDASGDGTGNILSFVNDIALDPMGNVYVTGGAATDGDAFKITPSGTITQIIDSAGDGAGNTLGDPVSVAADSTGNVFVTGTFFSNNVFRITSAGTITLVMSGAGDGAGHPLDLPTDVAVDAANNVYVTGVQSDNAFKITPSGVITQIIDSTGDGAGNVLTSPRFIAVDPAGNVYVMEDAFTGGAVFKITPSGGITQIISNSGAGGMAVDSSGNVCVSDGFLSDSVFKITPNGAVLEIIDGVGDDMGHTLSGPMGVASDAAGNVYVAGRQSENAFKINLEGGLCGDGIIGSMEQCDDANRAILDGCSASCRIEPGFQCAGEPSACVFTCGDGIIDTMEECDDFNLADGDGCSAACIIEPGFKCTGEPSVCVLSCGDGVIDTMEECDDFNIADGDGCSALCVIEPGFQCAGQPSACFICGNGVVDPTETCDDFNTLDGDGCSAACVVEPGFQCTGAPSVCVFTCGDGILDAGEQCDDGFNDACGSCNTLCTGSGDGSTCGDGVVCPETEACDDAFTDACGTCDATCTGPGVVSICGDGIVCAEAEEECDDGGVVDGDGCASTCAVEPGWVCTGEPSVCEFMPCLESSAATAELIGGVASIKNRYLSFSAGEPGRLQAVRVTAIDLPAPFDVLNGTTFWVGDPFEVSELSGKDDLTPPTSHFATLQCEPAFLDWSGLDVVHVLHEALVPAGQYDIQVVDVSCDAGSELSFSAPLSSTLGRWGDAVGQFDMAAGVWSAPDDSVGVTSDVVAILDKFRNAPGAPIKARADLEPGIPDLKINITDVASALDAFSGRGFPFANVAVRCSP